MPVRSRRRRVAAQSPSRPSSIACSALLFSALAAGCEVQANPENERAKQSVAASGVREREAPRVRVAPLEEREMVQRLETTTVIESEAEVRLIPRAPGLVVEVLREEGDQVEQGEVLARLDDRDASLAVSDAEVALEEARNRANRVTLAIEEARAGINNTRLAKEQAKRDFDRNDRLHGGDGTLPSALSAQAVEASRLELERSSHELVMAELTLKKTEADARDAENAVSRAEVALQRARLAHENRKILAPFDGVIASRSIRVGDTVGGEPVFVLTDTENLRAIFYRPQRELALFAAQASRMNGDGAPLEVVARAEALPEAVFRGYVERTSPTIDAQSGSFRVTARLSIAPEQEDARETSHLRLLPGMLVRLQIVTDRHPRALVVLKRSVRREGEESFVLKVVDGIASRVQVEEGFAEQDFIEILPLVPGALTPGDAIITVGARDLIDGSEVQVESPDEGQSPEATAPEESDEGVAPETEADESPPEEAEPAGTEE